MNHPSIEALALFSSADLPLLDRWKIRRHIAACERCDRQISLFRASLVEFKRQAKTETLTGFEAVVDWSRLEREMEGNIIVGLAAARCIEQGPNHRGLLIKFSLATVMVTLFVMGWMTHVPSEQAPASSPSCVTLFQAATLQSTRARSCVPSPTASWSAPRKAP